MKASCMVKEWGRMLTAVVLTVGMFFCIVGCESESNGSDALTIENDSVVDCDKDVTGTVRIPKGVTSIGRKAFSECTGLTSVEIPKGVTSIGSHAFYGCTGLTSVTIPTSVTNIGESAFYGCGSLESIQYGGTKSQWDTITIGWFSGLGGVTIVGSDGSTWTR